MPAVIRKHDDVRLELIETMLQIHVVMLYM